MRQEHNIVRLASNDAMPCIEIPEATPRNIEPPSRRRAESSYSKTSPCESDRSLFRDLSTNAL